MAEPDPDPRSHPLKASWRRCTGARLGNKRDVIEGMLRAGYSKRKIARDLMISEHSVRAVALQLGGCNYVNPEQAAHLEKYFRAKAQGELQRVALQNLEAITPAKAQRAPISANIMVVDRAMERLEALDGGHRSPPAWLWIQQTYNLQASHSASRPTIDIPSPDNHGKSSGSPSEDKWPAATSQLPPGEGQHA